MRNYPLLFFTLTISMLTSPLFATNPAQNLNDEVVSTRAEVTALQHKITEMQFHIDDLDRETLRSDYKKEHPSNSDFMVINKYLFACILAITFFLGFLAFSWRFEKRR